jgi:CubicO group peptidase (beta-lactamase class C family)
MYSKRTLKLIYSVLVISLFSSKYSFSQNTNFPNSRLGNVVKKCFDVINNGDDSQLKNFINEYVSSEGLKNHSYSFYYSLFRNINKEGGGGITPIDFFGVRKHEIWVRVKSLNNKTGDFAFSTLDTLSGKLNDVGFFPKLSREENELFFFDTIKTNKTKIPEIIDNHLREIAGRDLFSGTVLICDKNDIIYNKSFGLAEKSFNVPNKNDTKFFIASSGKMFTSVAIGQLVMDGLLKYSDTLFKVLPEYPNKEAAKKTTIEMLLTHKAGLGGLFDRKLYDRRKKYNTCTELLSCFANEPLLFEPGTSASYSNEGYEVLGAVIEKITKMTFEEYVTKNIFEKVGMMNSGFWTMDDVVSNRAVGYLRSEDDPFGTGSKKAYYYSIGMKGEAAGGEFSTAPDLLKFIRFFMENKLVSQEIKEKTITPKNGLRDYGYGFKVRNIHGKTFIGHDGGGGNQGCNVDIGTFKDGSYTIIVMSNYDAPTALRVSNALVKFLARQ